MIGNTSQRGQSHGNPSQTTTCNVAHGTLRRAGSCAGAATHPRQGLAGYQVKMHSHNRKVMGSWPRLPQSRFLGCRLCKSAQAAEPSVCGGNLLNIARVLLNVCLQLQSLHRSLLHASAACPAVQALVRQPFLVRRAVLKVTSRRTPHSCVDLPVMTPDAYSMPMQLLPFGICRSDLPSADFPSLPPPCCAKR